MGQRWVRLLGLFEIFGALCILGFGLNVTGTHVRLPLITWVVASTTFLAGVLLVGQHRSGVTLSLGVQLAQVVSFNAGWRYVFLAGPQLRWVVASVGTGAEVAAGGLFALLNAPADGTLNAIGLGAGTNLRLMARPLTEASWAVGVNLVALFFAWRLWHLRLALRLQQAESPVIAQRAV